MIENTVKSRCRAAALPCRETTERSPKVSGTFGTVLRVSALLCKKYEVTYLCCQVRLNITYHIVSSKKGDHHYERYDRNAIAEIK